jgi:hypothetical protein
MFNIEENEHMDVLREYLAGRGIEESVVMEFCNSVLEGKYPERQAYNAKGILVTFPTPEYKAEAIKRGTHFEDDPTRKASNIFQNTGAPAKAEPSSTPGKTNLPLSNAAPDAGSDGKEPAPAAPAAAASAPEAPAPQPAMAQPEPPKEPPKEPTELPPPPVKSPQEKNADAALIKQMLSGDDYKINEVVLFLKENTSSKVYAELMERIRNV